MELNNTKNGNKGKTYRKRVVGIKKTCNSLSTLADRWTFDVNFRPKSTTEPERAISTICKFKALPLNRKSSDSTSGEVEDAILGLGGAVEQVIKMGLLGWFSGKAFSGDLQNDDELWCIEDVSSGFCFGVYIRELEEEVKLLKNLSHPNIMCVVAAAVLCIVLCCCVALWQQQHVAAMSVPIRAPTWVSIRRLFEQKLSNIHKCIDLNHLKQVHALVYKANLHRDLFVAPKLISAFSLCRQMVLAVNVFNQVQEPNVHLYNTLIRAHIHNSQPSQAFAAFFDMQYCGLCPDNFTYPFLLKACSGQALLRLVQMIHTHIEKFGFCSDIFVPNSLIDCYCKCGWIGVYEARKLFTVMEERDIVSWNSMIGGLVKAGELSEACRLFDEMPERDTVSWNTILDGYSKAGEMDTGFDLFQKMPERNVVSWSTMISGYCKAGDMEMARMLFDKMPAKNLVTWTIIISGYAEKGMAKDAISLFDEMEAARLKPDDGTIISILDACAESGLLGLGKRVHASIERIRYKCSTHVSNALVDMYAKCDSVHRALSIFNGMAKRDLVSWNAMIQGLAMHGHGEKALNFFSRMTQEGFPPDKVTFVGVLCACTHAGFVEEGIQYFYAMERDYGVVPEIEHYGCMIDLLGRGGRLKEAFKLVRSMPMEPNAIIWGTLLGACRMHNAVGYAKEVLDHVASVRLQMKNTGTQKPSGASSIELDDDVHEFTVLDRSHPKSDGIYQMIDGLGGLAPLLSPLILEQSKVKKLVILLHRRAAALPWPPAGPLHIPSRELAEMVSVSLKIGDGTARFKRATLCSSAVNVLMLFSVLTTNVLIDLSRPNIATALKLFLKQHALPLGRDSRTGITEMVASVGHSFFEDKLFGIWVFFLTNRLSLNFESVVEKVNSRGDQITERTACGGIVSLLMFAGQIEFLLGFVCILVCRRLPCCFDYKKGWEVVVMVHIRELEEEVKLLKNLSHPNIVRNSGESSCSCFCSGPQSIANALDGLTLFSQYAMLGESPL
ncbi:hypothetical protein TEA_004012 [Camellia sinensis var. sinensis]|uniref:Protein kinase domain-containing protein n=1 Tax=Camellia sinensis var. sinensis TaxID=542762 RepID=A0A4V3WKE6_CAMSN|nr:hypothetical protein TEA_004012 [Camellia sinensis var. sinensis]